MGVDGRITIFEKTIPPKKKLVTKFREKKILQQKVWQKNFIEKSVTTLKHVAPWVRSAPNSIIVMPSSP